MCIRDRNISQVYEDSRGLIWIGTCEGLNVYNPETDELIILGVEQGDVYKRQGIRYNQFNNFWQMLCIYNYDEKG